MNGRRAYVVVFVLALGWAALLAALIEQPGYTDAYYYYNASQRWVTGDGLTDPYLWTYLDAPAALPAPAFRYWMPLTSLLAAGSMALFGAHFGAAQVPSVLSFAALVTLTYALGLYVGGRRRYGVLGALLVAFGGFYTPFWTTTDAFAPYGLVGAGALIAVGRGRETCDWRWYALGGALSGLAHLARADGVLLLLVLIAVALWPCGGFAPAPPAGDEPSPAPRLAERRSARQARFLPRFFRKSARGTGQRPVLFGALAGVLAYALVMSPWLARNRTQFGAPLPSGGLTTAWLRSYDDLVAYPPNVRAADFWAWGAENILASRWEALRNNAGTFLAVETWVVLGPFALGALWVRRKRPFWWGVALYALALHAAMTLVFAFPGYRGGLFHSSAALLPFWAVLSALGLDGAVAWAAERRRWPRAQAQNVFGGAAALLVVALSLGVLSARLRTWNANGRFYRTLAADLPPEAVVMVNDPPALYYHAGLAGVVVPNADPAVVPEIARQYGVTHLLLDANRTEPFTVLWLGREQRDFLRLLRVYGAETPDPADDRRLFEIVLREQEGP